MLAIIDEIDRVLARPAIDSQLDAAVLYAV
jgi:hypothetical protein